MHNRQVERLHSGAVIVPDRTVFDLVEVVVLHPHGERLVGERNAFVQCVRGRAPALAAQAVGFQRIEIRMAVYLVLDRGNLAHALDKAGICGHHRAAGEAVDARAAPALRSMRDTRRDT